MSSVTGCGGAGLRVVVCMIVMGASLAFAPRGEAASRGRGPVAASAPVTPNGPVVVLGSVSCSSADACTAVGSVHANAAAVRTGAGVPVAERWNGRSWAVEAMPIPARTSSWQLTVSCPGARACFAVGNSSVGSARPVPLAERWNGHRWLIQPIPPAAPGAGGLLYDVACASAGACMAVGDSASVSAPDVSLPLAEVWNGTAWSVSPIANPGVTGLERIACPSVDECVAIDISQGSELWNGQTWSFAPFPVEPQTALQSTFDVSCASASSCLAVGAWEASPGVGGRQWFVWNGTSWSLGSDQAWPAGFEAVACGSLTWCVAAGQNADDKFALRAWNGRSWTAQWTPSTHLHDVWCASATACVAVGSNLLDDGVWVPQAWVWNGRRWLDRSPRNPTSMPSA